MRPTLEDTLAELHALLATTEDLDSDQISLLKGTLAEIQDKLDEEKPEPSSLSSQLTTSIEHLQGTHPVLTNTVARVADLLAQMGI